MKRIAIFASGSGTNAEQIVTYFKNSLNIEVATILTNNPKAGVISRMNKLNIPVLVFNREDFYNTNNIINELQSKQIDIIVLAGFLWLIPEPLIDSYKDKIINIHPSLLPKYGGKGMYGMNVHNAVIEAGEKESGITIHLIDKEYDKGKILFQTKTNISSNDTAQTLAAKIHILEHQNFSRVIEEFAKTL